jgi:hypothetical protein
MEAKKERDTIIISVLHQVSLGVSKADELKIHTVHYA